MKIWRSKFLRHHNILIARLLVLVIYSTQEDKKGEIVKRAIFPDIHLDFKTGGNKRCALDIVSVPVEKNSSEGHPHFK